jgi:hypothetical protein
MAAAGSTIFVTGSLANYQTSEWGFVVPSTGGALPKTELLSKADVAGAISPLSPSLTLDAAKGVVIVQFKGTGPTAGYSATLSAGHGSAFSPDNGMYTTTTPGTGTDSDNPLVYPNVVTGTTTVMITPATGKTCTASQAITNWRVDANTFTWVVYNCQ